jgi:taurine-pyruvate aminotransferase
LVAIDTEATEVKSESLQGQLTSSDIEHGVHGLTAPRDFERDGTIFYEKGSGVWLVTMDGKRYLDGMSGGMAAMLGFGNEELGEVAKQQAIKLHHYPTFGGRSNVPAIQVAERLSELAPGEINRFIYTTSGSDANEAAFKIARFYWREKGKDKYKFISLGRSYHGSTLAAMACTGWDAWKSPNVEPYPPGFLHTPPPYCYRCPFDKSYPSCGLQCAQALDDLIEKEGADTVAGFISEPFITAGGALVPPPGWWPAVVNICKKHDLLLIVDEVITGFGRTGKFWGCEHWGIEPDIMVISKGLCSGYMPTGATGFTERVYRGITASGKVLPEVHTFAGHAVVCAVALKNIEILLREHVAENAAKNGTRIHERLGALKKRCKYVGDVRGLGMFTWVELVPDNRTNEPFSPEKGAQIGGQIVQRCYEKGVVVVNFGQPMINFGLPLIATQAEQDILLDTLEEAIEGLEV